MTKKSYPILLFLTILIGWGSYRYFFLPAEWVSEFITKPIIWLVPTLLFVIVLEKTTITSLGLTTKHFMRNCFIGVLFGLLLSLELVLTKTFKYGSAVFNPDNLSIISISSILLMSIATAFIEETTFRGYIMSRLWQAYNSELVAILVSTILFVIIHLPLIIFILHYSFYETFTYCLVIFISGFADGFVFARTKTLAAPILSHALWNFAATIFR